MQKYIATLSLILLTLAGCASTRSAAPEAPPPPPAEASVEPGSDEASGDAEGILASQVPQNWHHRGALKDSLPGIGTARAYRTLLADQKPQQTVVVAVIDGGVAIQHEDLQGRIWTNADERPGNDRDDDQNGYVDDVHGWNFIGGPDGENVNYDTYELTRIYARLKQQYAGVDSTQVAPAPAGEYARYLTIKVRFEKQRKKMRRNLQRVRRIGQAYEQASSLIQAHLGTENPTLQEIRNIDASDAMVQRARGLVLYLAEHGVTQADIEEQETHLQKVLEYGYDPSFNPRPIVEDDYFDFDDRFYGNADVAGPDPGHGTHVAGIIAAVRGNGLGMNGIANAVRIMAIRAVPNGDERDKDVANAIRYAVNNGADIINMSFGKGYSPQKALVDAAVQYADSMGVLMVHAAGNDGDNIDSTASYPTRVYAGGSDRAQLWVGVGASSWKPGLVASFSNYGKQSVGVFAPGVDVYSTVPGQQYEHNSGTSMAAPVVSGLAALIMAYYPDLSAAQVRSIILKSAVSFADEMVTRPGTKDQQIAFGRLSRTGGIINAYRALQMAERVSGQ